MTTSLQDEKNEEVWSLPYIYPGTPDTYPRVPSPNRYSFSSGSSQALPDYIYCSSNASIIGGDETILGTGTLTAEPETTLEEPQPNDTQTKIKIILQSIAHRFANFKQRIEDTWLLEIANILVCVLSMAGIIIILAIMNGRPSEEWRFFITINGIISAFTVVAQITMLVTAAECIAQHKWLWLQKERPLLEIERFDDTMRGGLFASLKFILKVRSIAIFGAIIVLANTAFGPLLQQLVDYPSKEIIQYSNETFSDRAMKFINVDGTNTVSWPMRASIDASLLDTMTSYTYQPACPASNCSWDPFPSLAVCGKCMTIENWTTTCGKGKNDTFNCSYHLPDIGTYYIGANFSGGSGSGPEYLSTKVSLNATSKYLGIGNPIASFAALNFSRTKTSMVYDKPANADLCTLYWCVQTWAVSVVNVNVMYTDVLNTWVNNTPTNADVRGQYLKYQRLVLTPSAEDLGLPAGTHVNPFSISTNALFGLESYLTTRFSGNVSSFRGGGSWSVHSTLDDITRAMSLSPAARQVNSMALMISQDIRNLPENVQFRVLGRAIFKKPIITVRWIWLIVPLGLVILSILFLSQTIYVSKKKMQWKSSNIVLLLYGPNNGGIAPNNRKRSKIEELARGATMRIRNEEDRWHLSIRKGKNEDSVSGAQIQAGGCENGSNDLRCYS